MTSGYIVEWAVSPINRSKVRVVVDVNYQIHQAATDFLESLRRLGRSPNTERVYAGRVVRYLNYCEDNDLRWNEVSVADLARFLNTLNGQLIPSMAKSENRCQTQRFRSAGTANAILTAVCEFLKFSAVRGQVDGELINSLYQPKYLRAWSTGFDLAENQEFRRIQGRTLRLQEADSALASFTPDQVRALMASAPKPRDQLLCRVLLESGVRIGEALGLRREDMHLLSSSAALGCSTAGPHLHVRRRLNPNGAYAKSRSPRAIPVTSDLAVIYADYQYARQRLVGGVDSDLVFVNLERAPLGDPIKYHAAKKRLERLSETVGFTVRPHMFRHTAATRWLEAGVPRDVVQVLLGHVSPASMNRYFHPSDQTLRDAVDKVAARLGDI